MKKSKILIALIIILIVILIVVLSVGLTMCRSSKEDKPVPPVQCKEHEWGEWEITLPPQCTQEGEKVRQCLKCSQKEAIKIPAEGHKVIHQAQIDATCVQEGIKECYTCEKCHIYFEDEEASKELSSENVKIDLLAHNLQKHEQIDATCEADGKKEYWSCDECKKMFLDEQCTNEVTEEDLIIATEGHTLTHNALQEATCEEDGKKEYWECDVCHKYFSDDKGTTEVAEEDLIIPTEGHKVKHQDKIEATCEKEGIKECYTCEKCNKYFEDKEASKELSSEDVKIDLLAHNLQKHDAVEATCEEDGKKEYWSCEKCGKMFLDKQGETEVAEKDLVIATEGHQLTTHHDAVEATCEEDGKIEYWECDVCHKYFSDEQGETEVAEKDLIIPTEGHQLTTHHDAVEATCEEDGKKEYWSCEKCGKMFLDKQGETEVAEKDLVIATEGHQLTTHHDAVEATCEEDGKKEYWECDVCHKYFSDEQGETEVAEKDLIIPTEGHQLTHNALQEATCEEDGKKEYWSCEKCGKMFSDEQGKTEVAEEDLIIATEGHTLTHNALQEATCEEDGKKEYWECDVCHKYFSDDKGTTEVAEKDLVIATEGHQLTTHHEKVEATCEEDGKIEYWECDECKKMFSDSEGKTQIDNVVTPAKGHTFDENHYCTVCNKYIGTEGLKYELSDDGTYYIVSGKGSAVGETELYIPSTYNEKPVTTIKDFAFNGHSELTSVTIPDSVTSIGKSAFYGCSSLTSITIPDSVTSIGVAAFEYCSSLTRVIIGNSVTSIGDSAFGGCGYITSVYYKGGSEVDWNKIAINGGNGILNTATRYYYGKSWQSSGNYWHYASDGKTPIKWQ